MKTDDLTIEDVIDMSPRERDELVRIWMSDDKKMMPTFQAYKGGMVAYRYHDNWKHAGSLLEALPLAFKRSPGNWFYHQMGQGMPYTGHEILSKQSILFAACICAVREIEPEVSND